LTRSFIHSTRLRFHDTAGWFSDATTRGRRRANRIESNRRRKRGRDATNDDEDALVELPPRRVARDDLRRRVVERRRRVLVLVALRELESRASRVVPDDLLVVRLSLVDVPRVVRLLRSLGRRGDADDARGRERRHRAGGHGAPVASVVTKARQREKLLKVTYPLRLETESGLDFTRTSVSTFDRDAFQLLR